MFGLFKKKFKNLSISEAIEDCRRRGAKNLTINVSYDGKILFQVMDAKYFYESGLPLGEDKDTALFHFFHKGKPWANDAWAELKRKQEVMNFFHYENPKGVYNFVKNISFNSIVIEQEILDSIDLYDVKDKSKVSIDYFDA